jgi:predicted tellurium resistance membrane protein TerC
VLLAAIAFNLAQPQKEHDPKALPNDSTAWSVGFVILSADLVMSLDNVVALAAIARGNWVLLALGLLLSIPALMFGAALLLRLIDRHSWLIKAGAALLGWIAGDLALSDIVIAPWVAEQSPALEIVVPALVALAVLLLPSRIIAGPARAMRKITPKIVIMPTPKPTPSPETTSKNGEDRERYVMIAFLILFLVVGLLLGSVLVFGGGTI